MGGCTRAGGGAADAAGARKTSGQTEPFIDATGLNSVEKFTTELSSQLKRPVVVVGRVQDEWSEVKFGLTKGA